MALRRQVRRSDNFGHYRNYALDRNTPPVLTVQPGQTFSVMTEDAFNGVLRNNPRLLHPRDTAPDSRMVPVWHNPLCGPIYVEGAEPGDVLIVTIERIRDMLLGVTSTLPGAHHFAGLRGWEDCDEMYTGVIQNDNDTSTGTWSYGSHTYSWPLRPFIGTIATAPEWEVLSSIPTNFGSAAAQGGNMDCRDVRPGARVYLQSLNEGGLLFLGDVHASQGDGEVCGVANEVGAEVVLHCDVVKQKALNNVRIDTPESLVSVYCWRPTEEAVRLALRDLILWLEEDYGMAKREAFVLASICPDFRLNVYQACSGVGRLMTTVGAEMPKRLLPR